MNPSLVRRLSALALGLYPVLSSLVAPLRTSLHGGGIVDGRVPFVPYPRSITLLRTLSGELHVHPPVQADDYPDELFGRTAFDPDESTALLELLFVTLRRQEQHLVSMRRLAVTAGELGTHPTQPVDGLVQSFRAHFAALDEIADTTRFGGYLVCNGSRTSVFLLRRAPELSPVTLELLDGNTDDLFLSRVDIEGAPNARLSLYSIDNALDSIRDFRSILLGTEREILPEPESGLPELARTLTRMRELALEAARGSLNTGDRYNLEQIFTRKQERYLDAQGLTHHFTLPLLEGGDVLLGTATRGQGLHFDLPEVPFLSGVTLLTLTSAASALATLDGALAYVEEERARVLAMQQQLEQLSFHVQPR